MPFRPNVNDTLTIGKATYSLTEHPSAKGMPYGQSGRRGTVYQIRAEEGNVLLALKVFTQSFRVPRVAEGANALRYYAKLPGLQVCARLALTSSQFPQLIRQYPDLEYAVVMPWVEGKTWQEILLEKESFSRAQSLQIAKAFSHILVEMENRGVAHCDLSGPNVMIKGEEAPDPQVALVDVEDLYAENLKRPEKLSGGSSGYSHKDASKGLWQASADRFAGSTLLAEMLGWCDEDIRRNSYDEQYFPPPEMQVNCERYEYLYGTLQTQWGNPIADLFSRAWFSETLNDCPTLTEWHRAVIVLDPNVMPKQYAWRTIGDQGTEHTHIANSPAVIPQQAEQPSHFITLPRTALPATILGREIVSIPTRNKFFWFSWKTCLLFALGSILIGVCAMAIVAGSAWSILGTSVVDVPSMLLQSTATKISISTNTATAIFTPDSPTASPVSPQQAETTLPKIVFPNNPAIGDIAKRADGMNMLFVPASEFIMGSNYGGEYDYIDPAHKVYLDAYWIDQTEVTNKMYEMCVKDEKCSKPYIYGGDSNYRYAKYGNYPITNVNWNQATTYCEWAGAHLSTEAEWEKAARGTEGYLYPWGNDYDGNATNFCDVSCSSEWKSQNYNDGYAGTAPVGIFEKDKSPYGVYDLAGNVSEWVYDFFAEYQGDAYLRNPQGPNGSDWGKEERVVRGGSFYSDYKGLRVLLRSWQYPNPDADGTINGAIWLGVDYNQIGFRCAYSSP